MTVAVESFGGNDCLQGLCLHFLMTNESFCGGTRFWFVPDDKDDRLEVAAYSAVTLVDWMDSMKLAACYCHFALVDLCWVILSVSGGSYGERSQLGFFGDIEEGQVAVSICPEMTWASRMEGCKLAAFYEPFYFIAPIGNFLSKFQR